MMPDNMAWGYGIEPFKILSETKFVNSYLYVYFLYSLWSLTKIIKLDCFTEFSEFFPGKNKILKWFQDREFFLLHFYHKIISFFSSSFLREIFKLNDKAFFESNMIHYFRIPNVYQYNQYKNIGINMYVTYFKSVFNLNL